MPKNKNVQQNSDYMDPEFAGTDPQKVKKEIQKDVKNGQGAMTSREAGGSRGRFSASFSITYDKTTD